MNMMLTIRDAIGIGDGGIEDWYELILNLWEPEEYEGERPYLIWKGTVGYHEVEVKQFLEDGELIHDFDFGYYHYTLNPIVDGLVAYLENQELRRREET